MEFFIDSPREPKIRSTAQHWNCKNFPTKKSKNFPTKKNVGIFLQKKRDLDSHKKIKKKIKKKRIKKNAKISDKMQSYPKTHFKPF